MNDNRRADWWLSKEIYRRYGLKSLMDYQKNPLIDIGGIEIENRLEKGLGNEIKMIFDPLLLYRSVKPEGSSQICCMGKWISNAVVPDFIKSQHEKIEIIQKHQAESSELQILTFISTEKNLFCMNETGEWEDIKKIHPSCIGAYVYFLNFSQYISSDNRQEELIEKRTTITSKHHDRTAKIKPWLREDLPTIIPIKLSNVNRIRSEPQGGTHATPHPHQRRGNWATFRAAKWGDKVGSRVWRRPAWVGDKEWVFNGATYRVLL